MRREMSDEDDFNTGGGGGVDKRGWRRNEAAGEMREEFGGRERREQSGTQSVSQPVSQEKEEEKEGREGERETSIWSRIRKIMLQIHARKAYNFVNDGRRGEGEERRRRECSKSERGRESETDREGERERAREKNTHQQQAAGQGSKQAKLPFIAPTTTNNSLQIGRAHV